MLWPTSGVCLRRAMRPAVETWTCAGLGDDMEAAAAVRPIPAMEGLDLEESEPAEKPDDEPDGTGSDRILVPVRAQSVGTGHRRRSGSSRQVPGGFSALCRPAVAGWGPAVAAPAAPPAGAAAIGRPVQGSLGGQRSCRNTRQVSRYLGWKGKAAEPCKDAYAI